ncbi:MAG: 3-deoxy-7-phosphoheptulonate synthase [Candidatus Dormibacteraeota bacterium]|uniref:3-deoxy-7-phosphoheptulonate synthase n=1 Tax=Candidatus Amunia macphersoniae TaxID=3127014 RepID=A0A934KJ73_9BACT|nr:3-deoxy-7-phosphoheptulonate synthase [Candidatus Dormibacteraeota bacterium]
MLIMMNAQATEEEVANVMAHVRDRGYQPIELPGADRLAIGVLGSNPSTIRDAVAALPGVVAAIPVSKPYKLVGREWHPQSSVVDVAGVRIGAGELVVAAGPCAVESERQLVDTAEHVKAAGAQLLRGGAYKPRSSPYSFRGLGAPGLEHLRRAREMTGLPVVTEVLTPADVAAVAGAADMLQVGTRNAQNFSLLEAVGESGKPVLLKRGLSNTVEEWLLSAEYVLAHGNPDVVLCERGIRTFETATRNTLDLAAVPVAKELSHLPVIVDPSHATGHRHLVPSMALAAVAAGADGLLIEVHPTPDEALSDGPQSLTFEQFSSLMDDVRRLSAALRHQIVVVPSHASR